MIDEYIHLYGKRIFGLCTVLCAGSYDAEDLYQETWLKALKNMDRYDKKRDFEPWISRICVNTYRDFLRRKTASPVTDHFADTQTKDAVLDSVPNREERNGADIRDAVDRLPEKLRMTVILFYFADLGEDKTAEILKIPVGTVKSRLNKAKKLLKEELKDEYGL